MEEKKFPIYRFELYWNQADYDNNSTSWYKMVPITLTDDDIYNEIQQHKERIVASQIEKGKPVSEFLSEKCELVENETWAITWFSHYTINQFDTDEEALQSFREYVSRKSLTKECLMGAEDEWRWKLCRCEHCAAKGRITIDH